MNKKIIILIGGYLAAGKTTFSRYLSKQIGVLCIHKDYVKETLCDRLGFENRDENKRFSEATFDVMKHIAQQCMEVGAPIILESNFRPADGDEMKPLIQKYGYSPLTVMFMGDEGVLFERFNERLEGRHPAHTSAFVSFEGFCNHGKELLSFDIGGPKIMVDTTDLDGVCFDELISNIKKIISTQEEQHE